MEPNFDCLDLIELELFSLHEALQYKDRLGADFSWQVRCMNAVSNEQIFKSEHFSTSTILDNFSTFLNI